MKFKELNIVIADVLKATFLENYKIIDEFYYESTKQTCAEWYFVYENGGIYPVVLRIQKGFEYVEYYHITDLEKFKKEFPLVKDPGSFLIDRKDIINHYEGIKLDVFQAFRFIRELDRFLFKIEIPNN